MYITTNGNPSIRSLFSLHYSHRQRGDFCIVLLTPNMAATVTISSGATWQEVAADKQKHREATLSLLDPPLPLIAETPINTIPLARTFLTQYEITITETSVEDLVVLLAKGQLSSVTVTKAFLRRAALAQKAVRLVALLLPLQSTS